MLLGIGLNMLFSDWYARNFIHGDDDMNQIGRVLFFGVFPGLLVVGGWFGNKFYLRKNEPQGKPYDTHTK